ncbi:MAG TPA: cupredoxin family copper-binding protein [Steroidobacteraceae bacterium]|nr:cupredoxin family copper-binding protein [Steroidobacteraceae bacterium]
MKNSVIHCGIGVARSVVAGGIVVASLLASAACFASDRPSPVETIVVAAAHDPQSGAQTIKIGNFTFSPATLEVPAGTTLTWVNEDDVPHVVVGIDKGSPVTSPALDTEDRYSVVLDKPGTYKYFCSLHPHMTGTVVVK